MNVKTWAPLAVAGVLGLGAWFLGRGDGGPRAAAEVRGPKLAQVVVVKADVAVGIALKQSDLGLGRVPEGEVPAGAFTNPGEPIGRVPAAPLVKGQVVLETLLTPSGSAAGLPAIVPDGMRAVTLEVNEFSGLAGLLVPGCRVDVVSTLNDSDATKTAARTLASNIRIIAVGKRFGTPTGTAATAGGPGTPGTPGAPDDPTLPMSRAITLLVSPREAEVIELACHLGQPRLVLRGSRDSDSVKAVGVTVAELRGTGQNGGPGGWAGLIARWMGGDKNAPSTQPAPAREGIAVAAPATQPAVKYHEVAIIRLGVESVTRLALKPEPTTKPAGSGISEEGGVLVGGQDQLKSAVESGR